jgi:hypothetical protein
MFGMTPEGFARATKIKQTFGGKPSGIGVPARNMTILEARDVVVYLAVQWEFTIKELDISDDMKVIAPKAEEATLVTIEPNTIAGVPFVLDNGKDFPLKPVTLKFAVVLWRLATLLKDEWGATRIFTGGIGIGRDDSPGDCHNKGRCVDFFGADTNRGSFRVERDWGNRTFIRPDKVKTNSWVGYRGKEAFWYRLKHQAGPPANDAATLFFETIYKFAQEQCRDIDGMPTDIGERSFIMHPDHPDPKREQHRNHIHFQLGAT